MKSMTGYGSSEGRVGRGVLFAEIRGVNSRFLDVNCKLPFNMYPLEPRIRNLLQGSITRGKIEIFIKERVSLAETFELEVNHDLVRQYKKCMNSINNMLGLKVSSHLLEVVDLKELVVTRDRPVNTEALWGQIQRVILQAIAKFDGMRRKEGDALRTDQLKRVREFHRIVTKLQSQVIRRADKMRHKMLSEATEAVGERVSQERINIEIGAAIDRMDVTEELTRLKSHIDQYLGLLNKKGAVGRQIDFLLQEMHREINTLGSKASDSQLSSLVVEAKSELEKLREQVQNVE